MPTELSVAPEPLIHDSRLKLNATQPMPTIKGRAVAAKSLDTLIKVHATLDCLSPPVLRNALPL
jgi:hypothetical protein